MKTFANILARYRFAVLAALISVSVVCLFVRPNIAYAAGVDDETKFVFNTFAFLIWGALVMWMCAGFTMLESGSVRTKNASTICLKNIGIYSIAGIAYFVIGYNLMYVDIVGGFIGSFNLMYGSSADEIALLGGDVSATAAVVENGYSTMSDWFFQMVFVATAASIVSGTLAERVKMWPFFLFTLILTAFIYPVVGAWTWGGGWLAEMGFKDFAGSTIVHSTGGWAALAGVLVVGPRLGKFRRDGTVRATPPCCCLAIPSVLTAKRKCPHYGECDIDAARAGKTSGTQQLTGRVYDNRAGSDVDGSEHTPHQAHTGGIRRGRSSRTSSRQSRSQTCQRYTERIGERSSTSGAQPIRRSQPYAPERVAEGAGGHRHRS